MAQSRLERIGSLYTRTRDLLQNGAIKWNNRPIWYDLYEAFPPKEEPRFDRPLPNTSIKKIFYKEDNIRALFHKKNKNIGAVNLLSTTSKSLTQRFISAYQTIDKQYEGKADAEKVYTEALEVLQRERLIRASTEPDKSTDKEKQDVGETTGVNVSDLFK